MKIYLVIRVLLGLINQWACKLKGEPHNALNLVLQFIAAPLSVFFGILYLIYPYRVAQIMEFIEENSTHLIALGVIVEGGLILLACLS